MQITRTSILTGIEHTREIPVTQEQLSHWETSGELIQNALPDLSADDRECLLTGITPEEWNEEFPEEENE